MTPLLERYPASQRFHGNERIRVIVQIEGSVVEGNHLDLASRRVGLEFPSWPPTSSNMNATGQDTQYRHLLSFSRRASLCRDFGLTSDAPRQELCPPWSSDSAGKMQVMQAKPLGMARSSSQVCAPAGGAQAGLDGEPPSRQWHPALDHLSHQLGGPVWFIGGIRANFSP